MIGRYLFGAGIRAYQGSTRSPILRRRKRSSPRVEALEDRALLTVPIVQVPVPVSPGFAPAITVGPDNNVWIAQIVDGTDSRLVRINTANGATTSFPVVTDAKGIAGIAAGPDGKLWFTETSAIARLDPSTGVVTTFPASHPSAPTGITQGPDHNLWFTENTTDQIGRINPGTGHIDEFALPGTQRSPTAITVGPDNNLWFSESPKGNSGAVGRITVTGDVKEFPIAGVQSGPVGLVSGPDHFLWGTEYSEQELVKIDPTTGAVVDKILTPGVSDDPAGIALGSDNNLWFTETSSNSISQLVVSTRVITDQLILSSGADLIVAAPDGNLWFTQQGTRFHVGVAVLKGPGPVLVPPDTTPPTITSAQIFTQTVVVGHDRKGHPKTKTQFAGFRLVFSKALDAGHAQSAANYSIVTLTKKGKKLISQTVAFTPTYDSSANTVTLIVSGKPKFKSGGSLTITAGGIVDTSGNALGGNTTFTILTGAKGIG